MAYHYGYVRVERGGRRIRLHRYVMEQHLGRELQPWEVVRHKDGNRANNALENLELVTPEELARTQKGGVPNPKPARFRPWNALPMSKVRRILSLREKGYSYSEIGRRVGAHNQTVREYVRKAGRVTPATQTSVSNGTMEVAA